MSATEKETLRITRTEYSALVDVRGLESSGHFMVMCARMTESSGYILEGTSSAFNALQSDLSDEIHHELSPPSRLRSIRKLYDRLCPDNDL